MATATKTVKVGGREYLFAPLEVPASDTPAAEYFAITPAVAAEWLKWNRSNRTLRTTNVGSHAADMSGGNWSINGETIKLSRPLRSGEIEDMPEGRVLFLDGQHRFEACVSSGEPFVSLVAYGLEPDSRDTMDTGRARSMGDVLKMHGETLSPMLGSVLRRVWMWDNGDRRFSGSRKPTHAELLALFRTDPQGFRSAVDKGYWVRLKYRDLPPSVVGTAWYILNRVSREDAPWFFSALKTGVGLNEENHPILTLRNRLARDRTDKKPSIAYHQLAMIIRTWNFYRSDQLMSRMDQTLNDATPDPQ